MLVAEKISKTFPGVKALEKINFHLEKGEVHALVGENGAGKSTFVKILSGVYSKDKGSGRILIEGKEVNFEDSQDAFESGVAVIHQELSLFNSLDVATNILIHRMPLAEKGWRRILRFVDKDRVYKEAERVLRSMDADVSAFEKVDKLNASRKKMVEIAKALCADARIILMDEPTASLTTEEQIELFKKIRSLRDRGVSIIYISHRLEEILDIADRITILRDGKKIATKAVKDTHLEEIISLMVGRVIKERYPKEPGSIGETLFEVRDLSRGTLLNGISFSVKKGEILGVAGRVGSGRTEMARAIFGIDQTKTGEVFLEGRKLAIRSVASAITSGLAYLSEDRRKEGLIPLMSVVDNFILPAVNSKKVRRKFLVWVSFLSQSKIRETCQEFVRKLAIKIGSSDNKVAYLSGGNQQKLIVSKWLNTQAAIFIFDEPTVGIDVTSKIEIYRIMQDLAKKGIGILMISSDLEELISISDRIIVLRNGYLVAEVLRDSFSTEDILRLAATGNQEKIDESGN